MVSECLQELDQGLEDGQDTCTCIPDSHINAV